MMPPSTREVMNSVGSKYAVVVGISKRAREMAGKKELEEKEGRLANMVNHTLEDLIADKLSIRHAVPAEPVAEETTAETEETAEETETTEETSEEQTEEQE